MMQTLILTFVVFLAAVLAMVVGVLVTGRSLKGSCGGPSCTTGDYHNDGVLRAVSGADGCPPGVSMSATTGDAGRPGHPRRK